MRKQGVTVLKTRADGFMLSQNNGFHVIIEFFIISVVLFVLLRKKESG